MLVLICFLMNNAAMNFSCFYNETKNESYICSTEVNCHISMIHSKLPVYVCMQLTLDCPPHIQNYLECVCLLIGILECYSGILAY